MFRKITRSALALFAGLTLALAAHAQDDIRIGVIAPMTGPSAQWGIAAAQAQNLLADQYNATGGLVVAGKKYPIKVFAYDDQYKTTASVAAFNRLLRQDNVKFVVILSSAATLALRDTIEENKIIGLSAAYAKDALTANSHYLFRIYSPPSDYEPGMVEWLKKNTPAAARSVVLVNPNDETGWATSKFSAGLFAKDGYKVLSEELFERSQSDFAPLVTKILAAKPDVIDLGVTPPASAGLIVRQAREFGYKGLFFMPGGAGPNGVIAGAGNAAVEGLVCMLYADPGNAGYKALATAYEKRTGHAPNAILVPFYDGTRVLLAAIQQAGSVSDTAAIAKAFAKTLPMPSVQGEQLTLSGQQINTVNYIAVVKNGAPEIRGKTGGR